MFHFTAQSPKHAAMVGTVITIVTSTIFGAVGGALVTSYSTPATVTTTVEDHSYVEESQLIDARNKVAPAVVSIVEYQDSAALQQQSLNFGFPFGFTQPYSDTPQSGESTPTKVGGGTGFIVTADGLVMTNKHVVADTTGFFEVVLNDGTVYSADVVARDSLNDVAFVQMKPKEGEESSDAAKRLGTLPVVDFGDSDALQVGQHVLAIGNALAQYDNTTTAGIISATGRKITASDSYNQTSETLTGLIQTDAAINPGNSGGPLVDFDGKVIGINTAIDTQATGIGFALPINDVKPLLASYQKNGRIVRPMLGVRYIILNAQRAKQLGLSVDYGALLVGDDSTGEFAVIPGSPADKAGLEKGNVILSVGGQKVTEDFPLQNALAGYEVGDTVTFIVWVSGEEKEFTVTLTENTLEQTQK